MRFRSRHFIDFNILKENYKKLKKLCPNNEVVFMVKADAYGHGAVPIVRYAYSELGVTEFGCATLGEALHLREELFDLEFEVYVFSDLQLDLEECAEIYLNRRIIPVISNTKDLDILLGNPDFKKFPISLKFNTGMNRLGIGFDSAKDVVEKLQRNGRKEVYHLLAHFSSASLSMSKNKRNILQISNFKKLKDIFTESGIKLERTSVSNSGAIEQKVGLEETHIRPGLMMYGPSSIIRPCKELSFWTGEVISKLETYIISAFKVNRGTPTGYGATPCPAAGIVAIIALGYGDGFSTRYQGVELMYNGMKGKVIGRVNMDMAQVFFEGQTLDKFKSEDLFTIWNHDPQTLLEFSEQAKTIPYEMFIQLTARVPKVYCNK